MTTTPEIIWEEIVPKQIANEIVKLITSYLRKKDSKDFVSEIAANVIDREIQDLRKNICQFLEFWGSRVHKDHHEPEGRIQGRVNFWNCEKPVCLSVSMSILEFGALKSPDAKY